MKFEYLHMFRGASSHGNKRPVTIVVGHPEPAQGLLEYLDETYPIFWLRLEGIFSSTQTIRPYNEQIDSYADELFKAGVQDVILVGFSVGGMLAAGLAARLKGRLTLHHTFLIDPSLPGVLPLAAKAKIRVGADRPFWERVGSYLKKKCQVVFSDVRIMRTRSTGLWIWKEFSKQLIPLAKAYEHKGSFGPTTLVGSKEFLKSYANTWKILNAPDEVTQHQITTHTHESSMLRPYAGQWLEVVKAKIDEHSAASMVNPISNHKRSA